MEKLINGVISGYSKIEVGQKADKSFAYVEMYLKDHDYGYKFFYEKPEEAKSLIEKAPIGSTVSFKIFKGEKYWNVVNKSLKVLYVGDGTKPKESISNQRVVVRQNALRHADEWIAINKEFDDPEKEYFRFAAKCEEWILRER